jgi:hypothetical protein
VIPDPQVLAAHLGAGTLVLIVGGERPFLVAVTGSPEIKEKMVAAYRKAGFPVQAATDVDLTDSSDRDHHPPQTDLDLDLACTGEVQRSCGSSPQEAHWPPQRKSQPTRPN